MRTSTKRCALAVGLAALIAMPSAAQAQNAGIMQPTAGTISAAGAFPVSGPYPTPLPGRPFHVQLSGTASAVCYLERQLDGSTWVPITVTSNGSTTLMYNWTYTGSALSEDVVESQASVAYRVDCGASLGSYTSGSLAVRLSQ